jgi:Uma2 family endonuclease
MVGVEWRFNVPPNSYETDSVVPDVAYLATYSDLTETENRYPRIPPDIVVEIVSPGDNEADVRKKREFYLSWGVKLVIIADPERLTVETHERDGETRLLTENDTLLSKAFPTLEIRLRDMFAEIEAFESA